MKHNYVPGKAYKTDKNEKFFYVGEKPKEFIHVRPLIFVNAKCDFYDANYDGNCFAINCYDMCNIIGEWPPEPKKVKGWVNVYSLKCLEGLASCENVWPSKEKANKEASRNRIACIPIEFTEGEGL